MSELPRNWLHNSEEVQSRREEFLDLLMNQTRRAYDGPPDCACCGKSVDSWVRLYRCYQCDLWLCWSCTREHMPEVKRI